MYGSRLELISAHGDQTIGGVRFVLHGSSAAEGAEILEHGLNFIEGRATVSTNIVQAYGYATDPVRRGYSTSMVSVEDDPGMISVIAVPNEFYLGYAIFTSAYIVRSSKLVMGAPLRYAGARKQLTFFTDEDTEVARKKVEADVLNGSPMRQRPSFKVDPKYVMGGFEVMPGLKNVINGLEVSAKAFEPIDFASVESALAQLFVCREPAQAVLVPTMVRDIVVGTIESVVMSRLRMMRWQGLGLLGYRFREGKEDVAVSRVKDMQEQNRRIVEYGHMLGSSSIFNGELAWLKIYATKQLDLMRIELEGAELEAM